VGSVGSFITLALAKMGLKDIEVWDGDFIQAHNLPNQFFRLGDLGSLKVRALQKIIKIYEGIKIKINKTPYNGQELNGIAISAVDSMDTRKFVWREIQRQRRVKYYIDTRMGGDLMRIYAVNLADKESKKRYKATLFVKRKMNGLRCTERTILYNILAISGITSNLITKILKGEGVPQEVIFDLKLLELIKVF